MLYPRHNHRRLLAAALADLENIHRNALRELLGCDRALHGREWTMVGTRELIRGNAVARV
jgi:hypothetical protein